MGKEMNSRKGASNPAVSHLNSSEFKKAHSPGIVTGCSQNSKLIEKTEDSSSKLDFPAYR